MFTLAWKELVEENVAEHYGMGRAQMTEAFGALAQLMMKLHTPAPPDQLDGAEFSRGKAGCGKALSDAETECKTAMNDLVATLADVRLDHLPAAALARASALDQAFTHIRSQREFLKGGASMKHFRGKASLKLSMPVNRFKEIAMTCVPAGFSVGGAVSSMLQAMVEHLVYVYARSCALIAKVAKKKTVTEEHCALLHHLTNGRFNFAEQDKFVADPKKVVVDRKRVKDKSMTATDVLDRHWTDMLSKDSFFPKFTPGAREMLRVKWQRELRLLVTDAVSQASHFHPLSLEIGPADAVRALRCEADQFGGHLPDPSETPL